MPYVTNPSSKTPIFQVNQHIGLDRDIVDEDGVVIQEGDGQGIDGITFANEVLSFNDSDVDELIFYINSQGGDVQKSLDMFNAIAMSKQKTHAIITGFAFSCAGWIPLAADRVDMVQETGRWMCHMPYDPQNPDEHSEFMDQVIDIISKTIASKSGRNGKEKMTQNQVKDLMKKKTYWTAEEMLEAGLIDRIVNTSGKVVKILDKDPITLNKTELNFFYKEYQIAQNKLISEIENKEFSEEERKKLSKEGKALPDGSFPIESEQDLKNAIHSFGRAKDKEKAKAHIKKRAKELGLESLIPDNWKSNNLENLNTNNQKINNMPFPKLVNRLNSMDSKSLGFKINLSEDSTEDVILDTIVRLENRLRAMNDDMKDKDDAMCKNKEAMDAAKKLAEDKAKEASDAMNLYNSMKEKFDNMEVENKSMKEEKEAANKAKAEADLKFRTERATNLVNKLIEQKRVVATEDKTIDQVREYLVNKATENFDDVNMHYQITPVKTSGPKPGIKSGKLSNGADFNASFIEKVIAQNAERVKKNQYVTDENGTVRYLYPELHTNS